MIIETLSSLHCDEHFFDYFFVHRSMILIHRLFSSPNISSSLPVFVLIEIHSCQCEDFFLSQHDRRLSSIQNDWMGKLFFSSQSVSTRYLICRHVPCLADNLDRLDSSGVTRISSWGGLSPGNFQKTLKETTTSFFYFELKIELKLVRRDRTEPLTVDIQRFKILKVASYHAVLSMIKSSFIRFTVNINQATRNRTFPLIIRKN